MPDLATIIAAYEARQTERPPHVDAALTAKGAAVQAVYCLRTLMAALDPTEWHEVAGLAVIELDLMVGPIPAPAEPDSRYCFFCAAEFAPDTFDCPACVKAGRLTA